LSISFTNKTRTSMHCLLYRWISRQGSLKTYGELHWLRNRNFTNYTRK